MNFWVKFFGIAIWAMGTVYMAVALDRRYHRKPENNLPPGFLPGHWVKDEMGIIKTWFYRTEDKECIVFAASSIERPNILNIQASCN